MLKNLFRRSAPAPIRDIEEIAKRLDGGGITFAHTGLTVSHQTAMGVATVYACCRVIADGCATPELHVYREKGKGERELARNIPEYRMLNRRPNEWQTSFEFRRMLTFHSALTGNGLAVKVKVGNRTRELIPVQPGRFQIDRLSRYDVVYRVWDEFGPIGTFGPEDVLHLPNMQWDLVKGMDAVRVASSAIGLAMAAEESQASLHRNGGRPAGVLTTDKMLSKEARDRLREAFQKFSGKERHGLAVLDNGLKYNTMAMTGVDAQHVETRRLQIEDICRAYGVFPIMIGHSDKSATFASAEAFFGAHKIQTMMPWWTLWRQRLDEFVLDGQGPLFAEFDVRYLTAGSLKDRAQWARTMAEMGIYTRNELRDEEGKDPLDGLDEPLTPLNMSGSTSTGDAHDPADPAV